MKFKLLTCAVALLLLANALPPSIAGNDRGKWFDPPPSLSEVPNYEQVKRNLPAIHTDHSPDTSRLPDHILRNFDPRSLSTCRCEVEYSVLYWSGVPILKKVCGVYDSTADDFYCEQAIWETLCPKLDSENEITCKFSGKIKTDSGFHPELARKSSNSVALHLIPLGFPSPDIFIPRFDLNGKDNTLHISKSKLSSPALSQLRIELLSLLHKGDTKSGLLDRAQEIKLKYSQLFE